MLTFLSISALLMWLTPFFFPSGAAFILDFSFYNAIFFAIFTVFTVGSHHFAYLKKHVGILAFFSSIVFSFHLSIMAYATELNFYVMRFYWVFVAFACLCFSKKMHVFLLLLSCYTSTSVVHFLLPPEKIYYATWSYLLMMPPLMIIYYHLVSQSIARDRKLAENERSLLRKTEELDTILNALNAMVSYKDGNNVLKKVNQAMAKFIGKTKEQIEGTSLYDLFPSEIAKEFHEEDLMVMHTGNPMLNKLEKIFYPPTGQILWLRTSKFPYVGENGEIVGVVSSSDDVTDQILAEQKLRESEERFRMIFENAPDGMVLLEHPIWRFLKINRAFIDMLGYEESEILKMSPFDVVHLDDHHLCTKLFDDVISGGLIHYTAEKRYIHKNGKTVYCSLSVFVVKENDEPKYMIASLKDISQQKENDIRLKHYARQLEESNKNLQEFAYAVSHDLREPLRTVVSYVQLLKRQMPVEQLSDNAQEFMQFVIGGAKRMEIQIQALLDYSRVGKADMNLTNFDLKDAVEYVCLGLQKQMIDNQAVVEIEDVPCISGDRFQIEALLQNLISNAIKYRSPYRSPKIFITAIESEETWQISVVDNGIGIEEEFWEKIFAVFRRLHRAQDIPGTGVGLAICRRIVQRHDGEIWVTSIPGSGTTVHFCLPKILMDSKLNKSIHTGNEVLASSTEG